MMTQVLVAMMADASGTPAGSVTDAAGPSLAPWTVAQLTAIFGALAVPTRLRIVHLLSAGERSVGDIAAALSLAVPAVSQHLRILRDLRIVRNRRAGKQVYYALDDAHVADLFAIALAHVQGGAGQ